ncbi:MAG UNVERIFIED_CONTAM: hypothetical protein LVT10_19835 [Anaerolineae bacterium]|jgi:hypothetical protein
MMSQFTSISPNQRLVLPYTRVKREVLLPNNLIGTVLVRVGQQVNPNTVIASGNRTTQHHLVNCAAELGLRRTAKLTDVLMVKLGDVVKQGEVLAGQQLQRGKRSFAPVDGQVVAIEDGTLIIRQIIDRVDLLAGMRGVVTDVRPGRGIEIEGSGALLQGVWGNNRRAVGSLRLEPERGIEMPPNEWRGTIMVTPHPVTAVTLVRMEQLAPCGVDRPQHGFHAARGRVTIGASDLVDGGLWADEHAQRATILGWRTLRNATPQYRRFHLVRWSLVIPRS